VTKQELSKRTKIVLLDDFSLQIVKDTVDGEVRIMLSVTETEKLLEVLNRTKRDNKLINC